MCLCNRSRRIGSASASVISGEEQFEDYGEGEDVDFTPSSPCPEDDSRTNGFSDLGSSLPSRFVVSLGVHAGVCCRLGMHINMFSVIAVPGRLLRR